MLAVVVPWLEGGGAHRALAAALAAADVRADRLVILFAGSRHTEGLDRLARDVVRLDEPRSAAGAARAARRLGRVLPSGASVYSLARAGHVVLGLSPAARDGARAGSLHMLPSTDAGGVAGRAGDVLAGRYLRTCRLVTTPSARAADEAVARWRLARAAVVVEPNLVAPAGRPPVPPRDADGPVRLVLAGRLTAQKDVGRIAALLTPALPPVHLAIVGDGPEEDVARRAATAVTASTHHRVEVVGHVADATPWIDRSDAGFLCSRAELSPLFVGECWARGRPVLVPDLAVFRDLRDAGPLLVFGPDGLAAALAGLPAARAAAWRARAHPRGGPTALIDFLRTAAAR